jgi:CRISPR system Cascade subunit CasD
MARDADRGVIMTANTLFLRLEGPLQSWGERARWSIRDTAPEPTKSGIVGLLGCALGISADDDLRILSQSIQIGVRCDRPGTILRDYHTVIGGVMSAEGKIKINASTKEPETVVSERYYLSDASFLVAVRAEPAIISQLSTAIQDPTWPFFLGRKSCPPSAPVYAGIGSFPTLEDALIAIPLQLRRPEEIREVSLRAVLECGPNEENALRRKDEINSRLRRTFLPRFTCDKLLTVPVRQEVN